MRVIPARSGEPSSNPRQTFTGAVWMDGVMLDHPGVKVNNVLFTPCARTFWHYHDGGQILQVVRGRGYVGSGSGEGSIIGEGDTVWIEPDERHWHGGTPDSLLVHTAITLGTTTWLDEVTSADYESAGSWCAAPR